MVRAAQQFLEGQKELAVAGKPVVVKAATLLLPTRQEGMLAEGRGQVRSRSVVESEEDEDEEAQTTPVTRAKQRRLETGAEAGVEVEAKGLAGEGDEDEDDEEDSGWDETPLAERAAVAKAIARGLGDQGAVEAGPEAGPSDR